METPLQLPATVQQLLLERVRSMEELEALLLLRTASDRHWTDANVVEALRIGESLARSALAALVSNELCESPDVRVGPTRYAPSSPALEEAVDELARLYAEQRLEVLIFISRSAIARVRSDALRTFAGAFRLKGKKDG